MCKVHSLFGCNCFHFEDLWQQNCAAFARVARKLFVRFRFTAVCLDQANSFNMTVRRLLLRIYVKFLLKRSCELVRNSLETDSAISVQTADLVGINGPYMHSWL